MGVVGFDSVLVDLVADLLLASDDLGDLINAQNYLILLLIGLGEHLEL